jgi:serine O-acetyltransferase
MRRSSSRPFDQHPPFFRAVVTDARLAAAYLSERVPFRTRRDAVVRTLRLLWVSDALFAQALYRLKARLQSLGVPVLPRLAHRCAVAIAHVSIGDFVVVHPGVYFAHGQVVIDGEVEVQEGAVIFPWVTIWGPAPGLKGATIGRHAKIGSGATIVGPVKVGAGARIGANAVIVNDVPARTTAVGVPAQIVSGEVGRDILPRVAGRSLARGTP